MRPHECNSPPTLSRPPAPHAVSETKNYSVPVPMDEIESRIRSSIEKLGGPPNLWLLHNPFVVRCLLVAVQSTILLRLFV